MKSRALPFLIALGLAAPPVLAAGTSGYGTTTGAPAAGVGEAGAPVGETYLNMPEPRTIGDITYMCGGIGDTEANYMRQQAKNYDMMVTFASQTGAFLGNIDVALNRVGGPPATVLACDGPIMLVDVNESGSYRIVADAAGFVETRQVRVNASPQSAAAVVHMTWPTAEVAAMQAEEPVPTTGGDVVGGGFRGVDITPID